MATFPGASVQLLAQAEQQPNIRPTTIIVHTHVGPRGGGHVHPGKDLEWHFDVAVGGEIKQWVSTDRRADANSQANMFAISIETGDHFHDGDEKLEKSWSALGQFDSLVELVTWCCQTHGIPAVVCPNWDQPGIGYHSMWGVNEKGPGDGRFGRYDLPGKKGSARLNNPWTTALGKTCPGPGKIAEFPALLAAVQARVGGAAAPPVPSPTPAPQPAPAPAPVAAGNGTTTVQPGEGWVQVAERVFGDHRRAAEIRDLNGGPTRTLHPGDVLQLP